MREDGATVPTKVTIRFGLREMGVAPAGSEISPPVHASEYHLINLATGVSHGGFETLSGARQRAREEGLAAWDIFYGNVRVEYHDTR
jgi:hypothetical protein